VTDGILFAFLLTALAGLSTGVGSAIAFFARPTGKGFLAGSLGFSAGVMIYVSFVEILPAANDGLTATLGEAGAWAAAGGFFAGVLLTAVIDFVVPTVENPHDASLAEEMDLRVATDDQRLKRVGLLTALAIGIHNFPEGFATLMAAQNDMVLGISIAVAIALHNIPEGISVSVPIYYATGSRKRAFWLSLLSGVSEPVGALLGWALLSPFRSEGVVGVTLAAVAGVMVFISLDQLIPNAKKYGKEHHSVYGLIAGMAVMALSLLLL
jgi:ZIP family zinc transporter